ncbi:Transcriptional regulator (modular protein) [Methylacidimicrobium sp. AP8]|uniref:P-II family nitrogen regulator n=1 Tax=Methylacidimicrobium sp. AP8 TaxID=2730359 RepID=UPI0018C08247|nr:P-II family nitrogen regulator [Methylacidimicrobium sp. AP8]CAB4243034.1 Transcriptional regulator (modular protein) [Methylacidimicrobium sp. AP8]
MPDQPTTSHPLRSLKGFQKVEAVIPRSCLGELREALAQHYRIEGALASRVKRLEKKPEDVERYLGNDYFPDFLARTKIELILPVDQVPAVVQTILRTARIRGRHDRIVLSPVLRVIAIDAPCGMPMPAGSSPARSGEQQAEAVPTLQ